MRSPGIEPGSLAWKARILTIICDLYNKPLYTTNACILLFKIVLRIFYFFLINIIITNKVYNTNMTRLVKGGKYAYGWSKVGITGKIAIPKEAMEEYGVSEGENVFIINGSRRSGGFGITTISRLENSHLSLILDKFPELSTFQAEKGRAIKNGEKMFCWTRIEKDGNIILPIETLKEYEVNPGDQLLSVRGSRLALGFVVRGPIIEEALKHPELELFL